MTVEYFNSYGGFSVGIPEIPVIDANGNVITNILTTGNVTTNNIYATHYFYSNGQPFIGGGNGSPSGANTTVQFNNAGVFGGSSSFTFNSSTQLLTIANINVYSSANLGAVSNLKITGGSAGYVLSTDGTGNLSWVGSNFSPGGSNTQIQFNFDNTFAGDPEFTYDPDSNLLSVLNIDTNDIVANNTVTANLFYTTGNVNTGNINVTGRANISGNLRAIGNVTFASSPNVTLGQVNNIHITGGTNGYVLTTDGTGNLSWQPGGGGGNGSPGGTNTQIQYNDNNLFAGSPYFTYDNSTQTVQISGNLIANAMQLGSGGYKFGSSFVYFATTASTNKTRLYSIPVSQCSGVGFEIIGTDSIGSKRQYTKISSLYYAGIVQFNEYGQIYINGGVGTFSVEYNPGDVINPPTLDLYVVSDSNNSTVYKMWITVLAP